MARRRSWREKLAGAKSPHVSVLKKPFAGVPAGAKMFVPSPMLVRDYMCEIPAGERRTILQMRQEFAQRHRALATCPLTASMFTRIAAEAACEEMNEGKSAAEVTPFWRLIDADTPLAHKLSCGANFIRQMRAHEAVEQRP